MLSKLWLALGLAAFLLFGAPADAGADVGNACKAAKAKAAGRKALDLLKAFGKNMRIENPAKLERFISRAQSKFTAAFIKAETTGGCLTSDDAGAVEVEVDAFVEQVVAEVAPTGFVDNGDGTITDLWTVRMWEKKDDSGGIHDKDNTYSWAGCCQVDGVCIPYPNSQKCQPNAVAAAACSTQTGGAYGCAECSSGTCDVDPLGRGAITTIWDWLAADMNTPPGFAGYTDWRIPEVNKPGGAEELETLFLDACPGYPTPCVDPVFDTDCSPGCTIDTCSCTVPGTYWSSITSRNSPAGAHSAGFGSGKVWGFVTTKSYPNHIRAVRGPAPD
jgi:hypothetical protein